MIFKFTIDISSRGPDCNTSGVLSVSQKLRRVFNSNEMGDNRSLKLNDMEVKNRVVSI
jgi:hypothetical protein